jgi:threonine dehydrogenase-like Zn-dependent dehydrogenase
VAHDVLAAEEFGMPAPDPALHPDEAHDVLAAEEFAVPAPSLHAGPVALPEDPTGIAEPHDVLAAEEFAMPAPPPISVVTRERPRAPRAVVVGLGAAGVLAARRVLRRH